MSRCGAEHPDDQTLKCRMGSEVHPVHACGSKAWPNEAFEGVSDARALRAVKTSKPKKKIAQILSAGRQPSSAEEGKAESFGSIKDDPHNWPIVQECIRTAATRHPQISTNEVWEILLTREDYTYGGDRGYMGSILSHWGRKQMLVGAAVGTVPNRMPWAHSGLGVNLYPSLIYKSPDA